MPASCRIRTARPRSGRPSPSGGKHSETSDRGTILNDRANLHFLRLAEHLNTSNHAMLELITRATLRDAALFGGDAAHGSTAALSQLWTLTYREAEVMTFADAFAAITVFFVAATLMVPLMRKVAPPKGPVVDAR